VLSVARYSAQIQSSAALANATAFAWFGYVAFYAKLRRVNIGVGNSGGTITSIQVSIGLNVTTGAVVTPTNATTNAYAPGTLGPVNKVSLVSAYATPPALGAQTADAFTISFNDQLMGDLPFELMEEWWLGGSTSLGIAFVNRTGAALPGGHYFNLNVEWEE
jgi:hypothetical protein